MYYILKEPVWNFLISVRVFHYLWNDLVSALANLFWFVVVGQMGFFYCFNICKQNSGFAQWHGILGGLKYEL